MRTTLLFLVVLLLPACGSLAEKQRNATLQDTTGSYANAIRWSDFRRADSYRQLASPEQASPSPEALADIRVTAYEINDTRFSPGGDAVEVDVTITFYIDDTMKLRHVRDHQHWAWDAQTEDWHITTPLPDFRNAR